MSSIKLRFHHLSTRPTDAQGASLLSEVKEVPPVFGHLPQERWFDPVFNDNGRKQACTFNKCFFVGQACDWIEYV